VLVRPGSPGAVIDDPDGVVVEGAEPAAEVRIEARLELGGVEWTCTGLYTADWTGSVDTSRHPSTGGSYEGTDPFGLFWSAEPSDRPPAGFEGPMRVRLTATSGGRTAGATYDRGWLRRGVTAVDVEEDGLVGRLYLPPGDDLPAVVVLGGSEGGVPAPSPTALLAGHGIAALGLACWRAPGLPDVMADIDVELVGRGCEWLRAVPGVRDAPPSVMGISRGGELALLAASLMPDRVGSAISAVGSAVPWGALGTGDDNDVCWRFGGDPVAKVWEYADDPDRGLRDPATVAAAEIRVECVSGRVLLLSGDDDQMWRSSMLSEYAVRRARRLGVSDRVEHVCYPDAGHACCTPPGFAIAGAIVHSLDSTPYSMGGTRAGNQAARRDSWRRIVELLSTPAR
jgi:pimeloyl-ACP methyl ester carboxylesterase